MGAVFAATQDDLGRRVAIKVLHPHLAERPDLLERFKREAMAAAALGHPNVVQVTDFCQLPGEPPFLVMEQLSGETLRDCIDREGPLAPGRVAFIAAQVLSALETTHAAGIVHRDLKPENVFLTAITGVRDIVKVLDFGLAKHDQGGPALTETGAVMGTPAYMAPEQVSGQPVTAATDLYALGAVMFVALTGRLPFSGDNNYALMYAIAQGQRPSIASLRPELDPALAAAIERAMAVDPRRRFSSATEMRRAIEPFAQGERPAASVVIPGPAVAPGLLPPTQPSGFGPAHPTPGSPAEAPTLPSGEPALHVAHGSTAGMQAPVVGYGPAPGASVTAPARTNTLLIVVIVGIVVVLLGVLGLGAAIVLTRGDDGASATTPEALAKVDGNQATAAASEPAAPTPTPPVTPEPTPVAEALPPSDAVQTEPDPDRPGVLTRLGLRGGDETDDGGDAKSDEARAPEPPPDDAEPKPDGSRSTKKKTQKKTTEKKTEKKTEQVPTGGTKPKLTFINAHALFDLKIIKAQFASIHEQVTTCYVKHEFSPGDHVHSAYHLFVDAAGKTTKATKMGNRERSPDLDACLFPLFRGLEFGPPKVEGGEKIDITYTAWIPGQ